MERDKGYVKFETALKSALASVGIMPKIRISVSDSPGFVLSGELCAGVDNPSADASLMDGFAVRSRDTDKASCETPVKLKISGVSAAGAGMMRIKKRESIRIFTGAVVPRGADAVVPVEDCEELDGSILVKSAADAGQHIQSKGENFGKGDVIADKNSVITPGTVGLLAAAGMENVDVYSKPKIALIGVGDELVPPGEPIAPGQVYSSNCEMIAAWSKRFGFETYSKDMAGDDKEYIEKSVGRVLGKADVVITAGGAWTSERDMTGDVLRGLGWKKSFGRIKMRPGKGTSFGMLDATAVFCLPGGPASCEMAFLQLVLPCLFKISGYGISPVMKVKARLLSDINKTRPGWTSFIRGTYNLEGIKGFSVNPLYDKSRMKSMAKTTCIIILPEDTGHASAGDEVLIQTINGQQI